MEYFSITKTGVFFFATIDKEDELLTGRIIAFSNVVGKYKLITYSYNTSWYNRKLMLVEDIT